MSDTQSDTARPPQCPDCGQDVVIVACGRSRPTSAADVETLRELAIAAHRKFAHEDDDHDRR